MTIAWSLKVTPEARPVPIRRIAPPARIVMPLPPVASVLVLYVALGPIRSEAPAAMPLFVPRLSLGRNTPFSSVSVRPITRESVADSAMISLPVVPGSVAVGATPMRAKLMAVVPGLVSDMLSRVSLPTPVKRIAWPPVSTRTGRPRAMSRPPNWTSKPAAAGFSLRVPVKLAPSGVQPPTYEKATPL
jgi:hypothetical protein